MILYYPTLKGKVTTFIPGFEQDSPVIGHTLKLLVQAFIRPKAYHLQTH